jgi:hypothetical protein
MTDNTLESYLAYLEAESAGNGMTEYLWPRTAIGNLQAEATFRVGVSDWREDDERSRPAQIIAALRNLRYNKLLPEDFSVLDICCGDALVLWQIKRAFHHVRCYGVDLNAGKLETHAMVRRAGVFLYRATVQRLFADAPDDITFDVVVMLNTYRGWESADLRDDEAWIPETVDEWLRKHARYMVLTVSDGQAKKLMQKGFWVTDIGTGENGARLVLCFPCGDLWRAER